MRSFSVYKLLFAFVAMSMSYNVVKANNITITDGPFMKKIAGTSDAYIVFGVSWENSWKFKHKNRYDVTNWDAAWVFAKYAVNRGLWKHAYIRVNSADHAVTALCKAKLEVGTSMVNGVDQGVGAFIYRDTLSSGTFSATEVKLRWDYGSLGITENDEVSFQVFAIEMVYIPEGAFTAGDGQSASTLCNRGRTLRVESGRQDDNEPIASETGLSFNGTPIPNEFPKGFKAIYAMKHEITQHAYVDFLNCLTLDQQKNRVWSAPTAAVNTLAMVATGETSAVMLTYRNFIKIKTSANAGMNTPAIYGHSVDNVSWNRDSNGGNIACNFLNIFDGLAYADFAGLRPMTELEFEKICRGPMPVVPGEYAWGGRFPNNAKNMQFANTEQEVCTGNFQPIATSPYYVVRAGSFARSETSREESGSAYYGVMNMSDNVWERTISVETGLFFDAQHGDGELDANGHHNVPNWPTNQGATTAPNYLKGYGSRGNQVSARPNANALTPETTNLRNKNFLGYGFRAVRTAPTN